MTPNTEALSWASLGALGMLCALLVALLLMVWVSFGADVWMTLSKAAKRAVRARLSK